MASLTGGSESEEDGSGVVADDEEDDPSRWLGIEGDIPNIANQPRRSSELGDSGDEEEEAVAENDAEQPKRGTLDVLDQLTLNFKGISERNDGGSMKFKEIGAPGGRIGGSDNVIFPYVPKLATFDKVFSRNSSMEQILLHEPLESNREYSRCGGFFLGVTVPFKKGPKNVLIGDEAAIVLSLYNREQIVETMQREGNGVIFSLPVLEDSPCFQHLFQHDHISALRLATCIIELCETRAAVIPLIERSGLLVEIERLGRMCPKTFDVDYALHKYTGFGYAENLISWRGVGQCMFTACDMWVRFPEHRDSILTEGVDIFMDKIKKLEKMYDAPYQSRLNVEYIKRCSFGELSQKEQFGRDAMFGVACQAFTNGPRKNMYVDKKEIEKLSQAPLTAPTEYSDESTDTILNHFRINGRAITKLQLFIRAIAAMLMKVYRMEDLLLMRDDKVRSLLAQWGKKHKIPTCVQVASGGTNGMKRTGGGLNGFLGLLIRAGIGAGLLTSDVITNLDNFLGGISKKLEEGKITEKGVFRKLDREREGVARFLQEAAVPLEDHPDVYVANQIFGDDGKARWVPTASMKYTQEPINEFYAREMASLAGFRRRHGASIAAELERFLNGTGGLTHNVIIAFEADLTNATYAADNLIIEAMVVCAEWSADSYIDEVCSTTFSSWRSMTFPSIMVAYAEGQGKLNVPGGPVDPKRSCPISGPIWNTVDCTDICTEVRTQIFAGPHERWKKGIFADTARLIGNALKKGDSCVKTGASSGKTVTSILMQLRYASCYVDAPEEDDDGLGFDFEEFLGGKKKRKRKHPRIPTESASVLTSRASVDSTAFKLLGRQVTDKLDESERDEATDLADFDPDDPNDDPNTDDVLYTCGGNFFKRKGLLFEMCRSLLEKDRVVPKLGFRHRFIPRYDRQGHVLVSTGASMMGIIERDELGGIHGIVPYLIIDEIEANKEVLMACEGKNVRRIVMSATPETGLMPDDNIFSAPGIKSKKLVPANGILQALGFLKQASVNGDRAKVVIMCNSIQKAEEVMKHKKSMEAFQKKDGLTFRMITTNGATEDKAENLRVLSEEPVEGEILIIVTTTQVERSDMDCDCFLFFNERRKTINTLGCYSKLIYCYLTEEEVHQLTNRGARQAESRIIFGKFPLGAVMIKSLEHTRAPFKREEADPFKWGRLTKKFGADPRFSPCYWTEEQCITATAGYSFPARWENIKPETKIDFGTILSGYMLEGLQNVSRLAIVADRPHLEKFMSDIGSWPTRNADPVKFAAAIYGERSMADAKSEDPINEEKGFYGESWEEFDKIVTARFVLRREEIRAKIGGEEGDKAAIAYEKLTTEQKMRNICREEPFDLSRTASILSDYFPEYGIHIKGGEIITIGGHADTVLAALQPDMLRLPEGRYFVMKGAGEPLCVPVNNTATDIKLPPLFIPRSTAVVGLDSEGEIIITEKPDSVRYREWYEKLTHPEETGNGWTNKDRFRFICEFKDRGWVLTSKGSAIALEVEMNLSAAIVAIILREPVLMEKLIKIGLRKDRIMVQGFNLAGVFEIFRAAQKMCGGELNPLKTSFSIMRARVMEVLEMGGFIRGQKTGDDSINFCGMFLDLKYLLFGTEEVPKSMPDGGITMLTIGKKTLFAELHPGSFWRVYQVIYPIGRRRTALSVCNKLIPASSTLNGSLKHPLIGLADNIGPEARTEAKFIHEFLSLASEERQIDFSELYRGFGIIPTEREMVNLLNSPIRLNDLRNASTLKPEDKYATERKHTVEKVTKLFATESVSAGVEALWNVRVCHYLSLHYLMPVNRADDKVMDVYAVVAGLGAHSITEPNMRPGRGKAPIIFVKQLRKKVQQSEIRFEKNMYADPVPLTPIMDLAVRVFGDDYMKPEAMRVCDPEIHKGIDAMKVEHFLVHDDCDEVSDFVEKLQNEKGFLAPVSGKREGVRRFLDEAKGEESKDSQESLEREYQERHGGMELDFEEDDEGGGGFGELEFGGVHDGAWSLPGFEGDG